MESADLIRALRRLNGILRPAVTLAAAALQVAPGEDLFRGLYVEQTDVLTKWDRVPEEMALGSPVEWERGCAADPLFLQLHDEFAGFNSADYAILLLAVAGEFEPGYERVFGFLQDDVTQRRPTIRLAATLWDSTFGEPGMVLTRLSDVAPLREHRLVELAEPADGRPGLLARLIRADEQIARRLFGMHTLDRRLAAAVTLTKPDAHATLPPGATRVVQTGELRPGTAPQLYIHGPDERAKRRLVEWIAQQLGFELLIADASRLLAMDRPFASLVPVLIREARWFRCLLFIDGVDAFHAAEKQKEWRDLTAALADPALAVVLAGTRAGLPPTPHPLGLMALEVALPDADERVRHWHDALHKQAPGMVASNDVARLADRYALTASQIEQAVVLAMQRARWRGERGGSTLLSHDDLAATARSLGSYELEKLTHKVVPRVHLEDLVLRQDVREQLTDLVRRIRRRDWVLNEWGFSGRQSYGNGVNALFAGPSGTGKTMAAEAIAGEIGKDLFRIDLTAVVSKYIGETEQRLEQIFQAGEASQAVLFFDEADSLLGKRSEVRDAHDRYANIEVSYLLQRMERYDGLIVLATNLPGNLDDAFLRRMSAIVHFPLPGVADRRDLWERVWPRTVPLAQEAGFALDYDFLAERFELTGGAIRNTALTAAYIAADRDWFKKVTMWDVLLAVRAEFHKLGQAMNDSELGLSRFKPPPHFDAEFRGDLAHGGSVEQHARR